MSSNQTPSCNWPLSKWKYLPFPCLSPFFQCPSYRLPFWYMNIPSPWNLSFNQSPSCKILFQIISLNEIWVFLIFFEYTSCSTKILLNLFGINKYRHKRSNLCSIVVHVHCACPIWSFLGKNFRLKTFSILFHACGLLSSLLGSPR